MLPSLPEQRSTVAICFMRSDAFFAAPRREKRMPCGAGLGAACGYAEERGGDV